MGLKLFASPLKAQEASSTPESGPFRPQPCENYYRRFDEKETQLVTNDFGPSRDTGTNDIPLISNDEHLQDSPEFHRHAEATSIELFYDLFFVANLTTFTNVHEVNDHKSLSSYVGFFCILWFTWYQVSLYDLRFYADSVFERTCKALQFGIMVGFAVVGPQWDPNEERNDFATFRSFSLILMVSRVVLCLQYASAFWFVRRYRQTKLPILLVIASYATSAAVYATLTAIFPRDLPAGERVRTYAYIGFYIVAIAETAVTTAISCYWRVIGFKGTHLVQRMSLLTLIILGEGVIGSTKSIAKLVQNNYVFSGAVVGQVVSAVLIIYFLYMLYFDRLQEDHFGTIRQQIWAFIHFPLHIALVLVLEGVSQFIVWREAIEGINNLGIEIVTILKEKAKNAESLVSALNATATNIFNHAPAGVNIAESLSEVNHSLTKISGESGRTMGVVGNVTLDAVNDIKITLINTLLEFLGIEAPEAKAKEAKTAERKLRYLLKVFDLVYTYFTIAAGAALLIMGTIAWLSQPPKTAGQYMRGGANFAIGVGLCLLSLLKLTGALAEYTSSPWVLPTLCLSLFFVVVLNHLGLPTKKGKVH